MTNINFNEIELEFLRELKISDKYKSLIKKKIYKLNLLSGEKFFGNNELVPGLLFVKKGIMRSIFTTDQKEILTINKYKSGDFVGKIQLLNPIKNHSICASTDVEGYFLPADEIFNFLKKKIYKL